MHEEKLSTGQTRDAECMALNVYYRQHSRTGPCISQGESRDMQMHSSHRRALSNGVKSLRSHGMARGWFGLLLAVAVLELLAALCTQELCAAGRGHWGTDTAWAPRVLPLPGSEAGTAITPPALHPLCWINGTCFTPCGLWYLQSTLMCALSGVLGSSTAMLGKGLDVSFAADPAPNPMRCNWRACQRCLVFCRWATSWLSEPLHLISVSWSHTPKPQDIHLMEWVQIRATNVVKGLGHLSNEDGLS